jgi:sugar-specific transcriptional regulator TrmB
VKKTSSGLSDDEIQGRVAVLKRLKELLQRQREKFENYLEVLSREKSDIESGDVDAMAEHVIMEQAIVEEIFTVQKVIDPLEDMYSAAYPLADSEMPQLKSSLETVKREVVRQSDVNRTLLKQRMDIMRQEIAELKLAFMKRRSVYGSAGTGSVIDISG